MSVTTADLAVGAVAALIVGLSKAALPGAGLLATPLMAVVFDGRAIPGATLGVLLTADLFAVRWYRRHTRWDLLRPLALWVGLGFGAGAWFFIAVGRGGRTLDIVIGASIAVMVVIQATRMRRGAVAARPTLGAAAFYGTAGGFTTFVSNNAGPIMNTHLLRLGLGKEELIGTSAWFYFVVNVAKVPIYVALGAWSDGGGFFTAETLWFDVRMAPVVVAGVLGGRALFPHVPQRVFMAAVLALAGAAALRLLIG